MNTNGYSNPARANKKRLMAQNKTGTGFFNTLKSAMSAAIGVQSEANRERDFSQGKPMHFIIAGVLLTMVFLLVIGLLVKVMIATST